MFATKHQYLTASQTKADDFKAWYDGAVGAYSPSAVPPAPSGHTVAAVSADGGNWCTCGETYFDNEQDAKDWRAACGAKADEVNLNDYIRSWTEMGAV
jgi:hypothetical protein